MNRPVSVTSEESDTDLSVRFSRAIRADGILKPEDRILVALSGGLDSAVLLHLLRFTPGLPPLQLLAAHFDHRMRDESGSDAQWVKGLCGAWEVPLQSEAADSPPGSEDEARSQRYRFLLEAKDRSDAEWLLTGHHGDDQAETVLFRVARGTGLRGLAGIPRTRPPGIYRPLLSFTRADVQGYAAAHGVRHLHDPTNKDLHYPRNLLRHEILPRLETGVAPGAREALRRMARLAEENEAAWDSLFPSLLERVLLADERGWFVVRSELNAYHPSVQARLVREILGRAGTELDEAGTRTAVEFTRTGTSGRFLTLPGGTLLVREFDRFRVIAGEEKAAGGQRSESPEELPSRSLATLPTENLRIPSREPGSGSFVVGKASYQARWGQDPLEGWPWRAALHAADLVFPLLVRAWQPGDSIRMPYGTKKLKKLFAEARIPVQERGEQPVVLDAGNRVLWVPGLAASAPVRAGVGSEAFFIGIRHVDGI